MASRLLIRFIFDAHVTTDHGRDASQKGTGTKCSCFFPRFHITFRIGEALEAIDPQDSVETEPKADSQETREGAARAISGPWVS